MSNRFSLESGGVDGARASAAVLRQTPRQIPPEDVGCANSDIEHAAPPSVSGGPVRPGDIPNP